MESVTQVLHKRADEWIKSIKEDSPIVIYFICIFCAPPFPLRG
jgi:hypothetical protein